MEIFSKNSQTFLQFDHRNTVPVLVSGDIMFFRPSINVFAPELGLSDSAFPSQELFWGLRNFFRNFETSLVATGGSRL